MYKCPLITSEYQVKLCTDSNDIFIGLFSQCIIGVYIVLSHVVSGTLVINLLNNIQEKVVKRSFRVARTAVTFVVKLLSIIRSLPIESRQNNIYPSNALEEEKPDVPSPAHEAVSEDHRVLPCVERLERLEKLMEELNNKPAVIPLEKDQMLLQSMDRIKSVEFDLEKTKRVSLILSKMIENWKLCCFD